MVISEYREDIKIEIGRELLEQVRSSNTWDQLQMKEDRKNINKRKNRENKDV